MIAIEEIEKKALSVLEKHRAWLESECFGWPNESCWDTVATIEREIREAFPKARFRETTGYFYEPLNHEWSEAHTWIQGKDGTIIDPTAGQFLNGPPLRVFGPDDPGLDLYRLKRDFTEDEKLIAQLDKFQIKPWESSMNVKGFI